VLAVTALLFAWFVIQWASLSSHDRSTRDFTLTYTAATIIRDGDPAHVYDWPTLSRVGDQLIAPDHLQFPYLQSVLGAWLVVPLTALGLPNAFTLWSATQLLLVAIAVFLAVRAAPQRRVHGFWGLAAIAGIALAAPGVSNLLSVGQSAGFNALGTAMAYRCWRRGAYMAGGAWLAGTAAIAKPHLALGVLVFVVGWSNRRAILGVIGGGAAAFLAFVALVGLHGLVAFFLGASRAGTIWSARGGDSFFSLPSMWFDDTTMSAVVGFAGGCLALVLCYVLGRRVRRNPSLLGLSLAAATVLSLLATQHAFLYDTVMIAPAVAWSLVELDLFGSRSLREAAEPLAIAIFWGPAIWISVQLPLTALIVRVGELYAWGAIALASALWISVLRAQRHDVATLPAFTRASTS